MWTVEGTYTAQRNRSRYTYSVSWSLVTGSVVWNATVRNERGLRAGTPDGSLSTTIAEERKAEPLVRLAVHMAIENGVDVQ